jgi:hypothetical protein
MAHRYTVCPCALTAIALAATAHAQVSPTGWPTSYLSVSSGWTGFFPGNTAYGAGSPAQGSSGVTSTGYDSTPGPTYGSVQSLYVRIDELRASYNPSGPSSSITHSGILEFTPIVNCQYTIDGFVPYAFNGTFSAAGSNATMSLFQVSGPTLASYSTTLFGAPNSTGTLFNAAAPAGGTQTGSLLAGTTYRWTWSFSTNTTNGADTGAIANVAPSDGNAAYIQLSFAAVPAPASIAPAILFAAAATRRRRR